MPFYRRYPYRRSYWRRSVRYSQKQGTRRFNLSVCSEGNGSVSVAGGSINTTVCGFQPFFSSDRQAAEGDNSYGSLVGNQLFVTYTNLYDEVKVNSMYVEIAITGNPSTSKALKVISCVDRHATINDLQQYTTVPRLMGSPEVDSKMFTSLDYAKMTRYFRARDRQERDIFVDSTMKDTKPEGTYTYAGLGEFIDNGSLYGAFNPLMQMGFVLSVAPLANGSVTFQYRVIYNLTFRNPKYGEQVPYSRSMRSIEGVSGESEEKAEERSDEMEEVPVLKKKKVVIVEEKDDDDEDELNPLLDESQEPFTVPKPVTVKKAGKKS